MSGSLLYPLLFRNTYYKNNSKLFQNYFKRGKKLQHEKRKSSSGCFLARKSKSTLQGTGEAGIGI